MTSALAVVLAVAPAAARASTEKAAAPEGKPSDAKPAGMKPGDAKSEGTKAAPAKPGEAKVGEAKVGEAKVGEAKVGDVKPGDAKVGGAKPGEAKVGEVKPAAPNADGKPKDAKAEGDQEPAPAKPVRPKAPKKTSALKEPPKIPGEGPSPASPPPMTMGGLRDEVRRENAVGRIDPAASPRTKVEQMLTEIVKTREALHAETLRLQGMMAEDAPEGTVPGGAPNSATTAGGKPAKHPLDILAKALRGIKPEQAAPIVSRLDKRLAATVLQRMPPVDAGKIMGAMKPDTAAELATQIAMRVPAAERGEVKK
jgi:flagellar motility protein MotE (MotC chaperone)